MAGRVDEPERLVVGYMGRAHGTRGEIAVSPLTDRPDEVFAPGRRVLVGQADDDPAGAAELLVESVRPHKGALLTKFEGVQDRNAAETLLGRYQSIPMSEAPEPAENEVFYHQLLGLEVETVTGEAVGRVREVFETEPEHMLEVKGEGKVHLVPFTSRIVKTVDLDGGRLVIDPPEGLLEL
jgi:16S rRNA processing protein RimM